MIRIKDFSTFQELLNLDNVILYFSVDWSGPERMSCKLVMEALTQMADLPAATPAYICEVQPNDVIEAWLLEQARKNPNFRFGGYGETVLLERGKIVDFILNPAKLGLDGIKDKLNRWQS